MCHHEDAVVFCMAGCMQATNAQIAKCHSLDVPHRIFLFKTWYRSHINISSIHSHLVTFLEPLKVTSNVVPMLMR